MKSEKGSNVTVLNVKPEENIYRWVYVTSISHIKYSFKTQFKTFVKKSNVISDVMNCYFSSWIVFILIIAFSYLNWLKLDKKSMTQKSIMR